MLKRICLGLLLGMLAGEVSGQVLLNEVCADNSVALSPGGTTPDYLELFNASSSSVNLSGWFLTDDTAVPKKFALPSTSLAAKARVVVWLDSTNNYPGLVVTNFTLRASGERVALYHSSTLIDSVTFGPQIRDKVLCRVPDGTGSWTLGEQTPGKSNTAVSLGMTSALRINEILATNSLGSDWLELYNPSTNAPVAIAGLVFSDQGTPGTYPGLWPNSFIDSGGFVQFMCVGDTNRGDHLLFKLSSTLGETDTLFAADRTTVIDRVTYGAQSRDVSYGRLPDGGTNFFFFSPTNRVTPGAPNDFLPLTNVVISEVLTHTDPPLEDAVELQNLTGAPVDVSDWWLSNSQDQRFKFRIPRGTILPAHGYAVFYEQAGAALPGFNQSGTGNLPDFTLNSAHGDQIVLTEGSAAVATTGYSSARDIPASANGVAFTRYVKSDGGTDLVPESERTFGPANPASLADFRLGTGLPNAYPLIGPLIITEIMFHPPPIISGGLTNDDTLDEFVELTSVTNQTLPLYDPDFPTNTWHVDGGITFDFPLNHSVAANASILLVSFDPVANPAQLAAFRTKYSLGNDVEVFGPYQGKLNNLSDSVALLKPDPVQLPPHPDAGFVPMILAEKVKYDVATGWPTGASGTGSSLQRFSLSGYANDQTNWFAAAPTAGFAGASGSPPHFTSAPQSQTVVEGATVTLTAIHDGTAPFTNQWLFNGTNLPGAIANPLVLSNVQTNQSGVYRLAVTNAFGDTLSDPATLVVLAVAGAPVLNQPTLLLDGRIQLDWQGVPGHIYEFLNADQLTNWAVLSRLTNTMGAETFFDRPSTRLPQRFYQIRLQP